jgi:hypothetical protein
VRPSTCGESLAQAVESARPPALSVSRGFLDGVTLNPFGQSAGEAVTDAAAGIAARLASVRAAANFTSHPTIGNLYPSTDAHR